MKKIGIVGLNARGAAQAAKRAGYGVFLTTYFSDVDTADITKNFFPMQREKFKPDLKEYSVNALADFALKKFEYNVESIILTSKLGDSAKSVKKLEKKFKIIGNNSENVQRAKEWRNIEKVLARHSICVPKTITYTVNTDDANNTDNTNKTSQIKSLVNLNFDFPCVIKAMNTDNGKCPVQKIFSFDDLENLVSKGKVNGEILIQEFVDGIPLSCSVLSDGKNAVAISVNRQIIGERAFGGYGLKYCGNIVPYEENIKNINLIQQLKKISEVVISDLSLVGSNGIDYVVSKDKIYFMEINPRIQDTLENVEKWLNINLIEEHINACNKDMNLKKFKTKTEKFKKFNDNKEEGKGNFYGKGIIYAKNDVKVKDLYKLGIKIGDVPYSGTLIKKNEPICCIYEEGESNADVFEKMKEDAKKIYEFLK